MNTVHNQDQHLRQRRKRNRRKSVLNLFLGAFMFLLFVGLSIGSVYRYSQIALLGQHSAELDARIESLQAKRDSLKVAMQKNANPMDVEEVAMNTLRMTYVTETNVAVNRVPEETVDVVRRERSLLRAPLLGQLSTIVIGLLYQ